MKFSAEKYYALGHSFGELSRQFAKEITINNEPTARLFSNFFIERARDCEEIGLCVSAQLARQHAEAVKNFSSLDPIKFGLKGVSDAIAAEMASNLFLHVRPDLQRHYEQKEPLFGRDVDVRFPSASVDISEAGNCLALERWTACVFHSMRVLEHGLKALAGKFKVPFNDKTWNGIIEPVEKKIREIKKRKRKPPGWKQDEQFYSDIAAQFMHIKNAWRNYTMHARVSYEEHEAERIFRHVRDLMAQISKRLKETP